MWVAGITQGLMWREYGADGYLVNSFAETIAAIRPMFLLRALGGLLYLAGALVFAWNIAMTIAGRIREEKPMTETPYDPRADRPLPAGGSIGGIAQPAE
jgi:cytochrome c oxidase cbb3-type subunit 1